MLKRGGTVSNPRPMKRMRKNRTFSQFKYKTSKPNLPGIKRETHKYTRYPNQGGNKIEIQPSNVGVDAEKEFARTFSINELQNVSDFAALYDQYRIRFVKIIVTPLNIQVQQSTHVNPPSAQPMAQLACAIDYDDNSSISWANITQYGTCRIYNYNEVYQNPKRYTWFFTPMCRTTVGQNGTLGGSPKPWQWIDINDTSVEHYGFKVVLRNQGGSLFEDSQVGVGYAFTVKYYLEFRCTR